VIFSNSPRVSYRERSQKMSKRKNASPEELAKKRVKFPVTLAKSYEPDKQDVFDGNWAFSLKLDGVRAFWDVDKKQLLSRNNKEFVIPTFFYDMLCDIGLPLDGEIFGGRGNFSKTISVSRKQRNMDPQEWKENLTFQVFDVIDTKNDYTTRMSIINNKITKEHDFIKIVPQTIIKDSSFDLFGKLDKFVDEGEEGLMLRRVTDVYSHSRSNGLLKMKKFYDQEMTITGFLAGKGKNKGVMGAVEVKDAEGNTCAVGSGFSDSQRENPPFKIGDTITVKYFERCKKDKNGNISYRFPTFLKMKDELEG